MDIQGDDTVQAIPNILESNIGYAFWSPVYSKIGPIFVKNVYNFGHFVGRVLEPFWRSPFVIVVLVGKYL